MPARDCVAACLCLRLHWLGRGWGAACSPVARTGARAHAAAQVSITPRSEELRETPAFVDEQFVFCWALNDTLIPPRQ